jgi:hypothetical protein
VASVQESVDDIRRRMAEIRSELHHDMTAVVEGASSAVDWRSYVRERPWVSLGAAFALGYVLVPRRAPATGVEPALLLTQNRAAEPPKPGPSLAWRALRTAAGLALPVAARAAQGYAVRWVEGFLADHPPGPEFGAMPSGPADPFNPRGREQFGYPRRA